MKNKLIELINLIIFSCKALVIMFVVFVVLFFFAKIKNLSRPFIKEQKTITNNYYYNKDIKYKETCFFKKCFLTLDN